ncbi:MAG: tRNA guanosine(34) transglycosylase Tgt, partial [Opitutales bacterium]
ASFFMKNKEVKPTPFIVEAVDDETKARAGTLVVPSGVIPTPVFMPVGTQGTVKGVIPRDLSATVKASVILGNTYHLRLRPGHDLIREQGGLGSFMGWNGPILTDSGGFQVYSLSKLRRISDGGVTFQSHLDGTELFLGPREAIAIQDALRSDIAMCLDECPPADAPEKEIAEAVRRTTVWASQCKDAWLETAAPDEGRLLFGIVQGGSFEPVRVRSAEELVELDLPGYAVGGVSVGESENEMFDQVAMTTEQLPHEKPRYVMGVGTPPQMLRMIALGADMFDCVMPSRAARHGTAFTSTGRINLKNERFRKDESPLEEGLDCFASMEFSRAYLRHLVATGEMLGPMLLTLHNLRFFVSLLERARLHLAKGDFATWSRSWIDRYEAEEGR